MLTLLTFVPWVINRDFKQITTATSTMAVMDVESWGEYLTVGQQISTLSKLGPNSDYGVSYSLAFAIIYQQQNSMLVK